MALTAETRRHRADLEELARLAETDIAVLFRDAATPERVREALNDLLPRVMALYGSAAASMSADWYDDLREAAAVRGRFTAITATLPDRGRVESLARWGVGPLFSANPDPATALTKVAGGMQRIIFDAARDTLIRSSTQDRQAGWVRVGEGECEWCQGFIDGEVHYVEGYDFDAHDWCKCTVEPDFG